MRHACLYLASLVLGAASLTAQPVAPAHSRISDFRSSAAARRRAAAATAALTVNPASREEVRQFYRAIYNASDNIPMGWTGSYLTGAIGDTSAAYKEATLLRINFFRALAGVPSNVTLNSTYNAQDQSAALMMSANGALQHTGIPTSWMFYTTAGAIAAESSNLALGLAGPAAINGYMADNGAGNQDLGHRRWLLYPQTREMGTGDVPGNGTFAAANSLWVIDGQFGGARPATRTTQVPYPAAGYTPYQLVWPRWSFTYPGADFSTATVTMTRSGAAISAVIENRTGNYGEPTLTWVYNNQNSALATAHPRPTADTTYTVNVNGVRLGAATQNFSYNVIVFDPDVAGGDFAATTINGSAAPTVGLAHTYTVTKPPFADSFQWRTLALANFTKNYGAESGLDGLLATTTPGYSVVQTASRDTGAAAYYLAHPDPRSDQILLLPEYFYVAGPAAAVTFRSRLGLATTTEVARVQATADDGISWADIYTQAGNGVTGANGYATRTASLAAYAGRTVRIRLNYTVSPNGDAYIDSDPANGQGWFIDNFTVTGVQTTTTGAPSTVLSGSTFAFTPTATGPFILQARSQLFGAYPLEWGPFTAIDSVPVGTPSNPGRLINLSIRSPAGTGTQTLIVGLTIGGAGATGSKPILVRAAGPALTPLGVTGALADPSLDVLNSAGASIASNDNWGGDSTIAAAAAQVGAFPFAPDTSKDAALYRADATFSPGGYSVKVSGVGGTTGVALAEIYDATPTANFTATTPRLTNLSARTQVGTGGNILIAGLTVGGSSAVNVLIRAIGPGLTQFGVSGVLADPKLELYNQAGAVIELNDNWNAAEAPLATSVGAFPIAPGSRDAALVTTLQPGGYTVQISGVGNTTGIALVEVYELP